MTPSECAFPVGRSPALPCLAACLFRTLVGKLLFTLLTLGIESLVTAETLAPMEPETNPLVEAVEIKSSAVRFDAHAVLAISLPISFTHESTSSDFSAIYQPANDGGLFVVKPQPLTGSLLVGSETDLVPVRSYETADWIADLVNSQPQDFVVSPTVLELSSESQWTVPEEVTTSFWR